MMTDTPESVTLVPIDRIEVLNSRDRNMKVFEEIVENIRSIGLKKPITVTPRKNGRYGLVCGQGRLEAVQSLGQTTLHWAQEMHCETTMRIFFFSGIASMARAEQTFMQSQQPMQVSTLKAMRPLNLGGIGIGGAISASPLPTLSRNPFTLSGRCRAGKALVTGLRAN